MVSTAAGLLLVGEDCVSTAGRAASTGGWLKGAASISGGGAAVSGVTRASTDGTGAGVIE